MNLKMADSKDVGKAKDQTKGVIHNSCNCKSAIADDIFKINSKESSYSSFEMLEAGFEGNEM